MKYGPFTPRPGDLFAWYYDSDDTLCHNDDKLWSIEMNCYVPTGEINLLISISEQSHVLYFQNKNLIISVKNFRVVGAQQRSRLGPRYVHARKLTV